ncbi:RING-box protein pip1 [Aspergillus terreus NIH2624]|jgi:hypothetical protein|uniref:RING-box protein pip1 n=1 Tax=Aspergillus terreus (strain NIH 2624 / FGSC A1156) TaxID=341663 RepID=Q0CA31_ASPTN|nr:RING-box protein pip1 [Aspergillus terreus NIH2624]EAU30590.1 RING-box protein pip1 [Aspergillus terreus NIH2624]
MADVEMKEAAAASSSKAKGTKSSEGASDGKKKFEVKKVTILRSIHSHLEGTPRANLNFRLVERCGFVGLGYRRRQLRHLP